MSETEIMRLTKRHKKGLLRVIFSRFFVILILILLQLGMLAGFYGWTSEYLPYFTIITSGFTLVMLIYLFNAAMDSSAKITWLFIMALAPIPTAIFLFYTRMNPGHRRIRKRLEALAENTRKLIPQNEQIRQTLKAEGNGTDELCSYVLGTGCFPVYDNTKVTYYPLGERTFEALLDALSKAEKFIFLEYFILEEGYMWGKILKILSQKAKAGVDVRVIYDGMCEIKLLPHNYPELLRREGIKCKIFAPIAPFISTHYNNRDHRKIAVIDGQVAFNGGVNLADEYINRVQKFGHWKDAAIKVEGDAVRSFTLMFLHMWNIDERNPEFEQYVNLPAQNLKGAAGYAMPYGDSPLDGEKVGENVYIDILYRANDYVHIMTPYLILDDELQTALKYAAKRGVDVKLILPGIPDKIAANALAKTHYHELVRAGVKIYEYTPGFVHSKVFVSDDIKAVVGTINLDYRSLYHHFECATYLYRMDCIADIETDYQETLQKCREVTSETIRREKIRIKLLGKFIKLFAPMM